MGHGNFAGTLGAIFSDFRRAVVAGIAGISPGLLDLFDQLLLDVQFLVLSIEIVIPLVHFVV